MKSKPETGEPQQVLPEPGEKQQQRQLRTTCRNKARPQCSRRGTDSVSWAGFQTKARSGAVELPDGKKKGPQALPSPRPKIRWVVGWLLQRVCLTSLCSLFGAFVWIEKGCWLLQSTHAVSLCRQSLLDQMEARTGLALGPQRSLPGWALMQFSPPLKRFLLSWWLSQVGGPPTWGFCLEQQINAVNKNQSLPKFLLSKQWFLKVPWGF